MTLLLIDDRAYPVTASPIRVRLAGGELGVLVYATTDGLLGVQLDGEARIDEWHPSLVSLEVAAEARRSA